MTGRHAPSTLIATAKSYPFAAPADSFLFVDGSVLPLRSIPSPALEDAEIEVGGALERAGDYLARRGLDGIAPMTARCALLAYGANAAPERLALKFAPLSPGAVFPVVRARLHDFDVVYAAHISGYGAVPATIERSPGTVCHVAITYLDAAQTARMHETELPRRTYVFGRLTDIHAEPDMLAPLGAVHGYVGRHGHLAPDGAPCALAAIRADRRSFTALSQSDMHARAHALLGATGALDAFILDAITDEAVRRRRTRALRAHARPFSHAGFHVAAH